MIGEVKEWNVGSQRLERFDMWATGVDGHFLISKLPFVKATVVAEGHCAVHVESRLIWL
jgi:hypothetical protein